MNLLHEHVLLCCMRVVSLYNYDSVSILAASLGTVGSVSTS